MQRYRNQNARLENSYVFRTPSGRLSPLRSLVTHDAIPNFPEDAAAIDHIELRTVRFILEHLEVEVPGGGVGNARVALKKAIGIFGVYTPFTD